MTNAELIDALRNCGRRLFDGYDCKNCVMYGDQMCDDSLKCRAANALEAAEHRIADLETALAACRIQRGEQLPKGNFWEIVS